MSRWGSCDFRELEELEERLKKLADADVDRVLMDTGTELAKIHLNKTKKYTPVGHIPYFDEPMTRKVTGASGKTRSILTKAGAIKQTYWQGYRGGTLRDAWKALPGVKKRGHFVFVVVNPMYYASYVEYGHRQEAGRYVPALGKKLKASWVRGRYMLTKSEKELERIMPRELDKAVSRMLKEAFDGDGK